MRDLSNDEIEAVSGADLLHEVNSEVPPSVQFIGSVGAGAMVGAIGGPVGAIIGGAGAGVAWILTH